jgi:hypothetical protein
VRSQYGLCLLDGHDASCEAGLSKA